MAQDRKWTDPAAINWFRRASYSHYQAQRKLKQQHCLHGLICLIRKLMPRTWILISSLPKPSHMQGIPKSLQVDDFQSSQIMPGRSSWCWWTENGVKDYRARRLRWSARSQIRNAVCLVQYHRSETWKVVHVDVVLRSQNDNNRNRKLTSKKLCYSTLYFWTKTGIDTIDRYIVRYFITSKRKENAKILRHDSGSRLLLCFRYCII